jgi:hypothetical protein
MSKALWWHLGRNIAAAARAASLPAQFMQDLHQRMRNRSVLALLQLLISARVYGSASVVFVHFFSTESVSIVLYCLQVFTGFLRFKQTLLKCGMLDTNCQTLFARKEGRFVILAALL